MSTHTDLFFSLKDKNGTEHSYVVAPHIGSQGLEVIDAMLAIGMGPMAEGFFSAARATEAQRAVTGNEEINTTAILEHIDLDHVVTSAQAGIKSVGGMSVLAPLVLQYTTRDGQKLITGSGKSRNTAAFDLAYTRNWGELRGAFLKVMEINGFFELLAGWFVEEV